MRGDGRQGSVGRVPKDGDAAGLLTKVTDPDANETDFTYNAARQLTRQDNENGTYTLYTYTDRGWVDTITHKKSDATVFLSLDYTYDAVGNRTGVVEHDGDTVDYGYDDLYRLTRETRKDDEEAVEYDYSYTYDAVANRTQKRDEVTEDETDYTCNNMNQMTAAGNISYTWDDAGNMATKVVNQQTTTYTWDSRNKLVALDFPEGDDVTLRYDGDGSRYKKAVGTTTTTFLFDTNVGLAALLFELDATDTVQAKYRADAGGLLLAMKRGATLSTYHFDVLGSPRVLTNASQTVTDSYEYDAWGNGTAASGASANPFRFVGEKGYYYEDIDGVYLLRARYYRAAVGTFLSRDAVRANHPYAYVSGRVTTAVDPSGEDLCVPWSRTVTTVHSEYELWELTGIDRVPPLPVKPFDLYCHWTLYRWVRYTHARWWKCYSRCYGMYDKLVKNVDPHETKEFVRRETVHVKWEQCDPIDILEKSVGGLCSKYGRPPGCP